MNMGKYSGCYNFLWEIVPLHNCPSVKRILVIFMCTTLLLKLLLLVILFTEEKGKKQNQAEYQSPPQPFLGCHATLIHVVIASREMDIFYFSCCKYCCKNCKSVI